MPLTPTGVRLLLAFDGTLAGTIVAANEDGQILCEAADISSAARTLADSDLTVTHLSDRMIRIERKSS